MKTKDLKQYTGTKTVKAMPMTLGEAEQVLNRRIDTSAVENREQVPGYLVEYGEDGDNYRSWSPKEVFERAYRPSETPLDCMLIEYDQLKDRIMKLQAFYLGCRIARALNKQKAEELAKAELESKQQEAEAARLQMQALVGLTVVEAGRCDFCPNESSGCKKLQLADGSYICLVDNRKNCTEPGSANTQDLTGGDPTPVL